MRCIAKTTSASGWWFQAPESGTSRHGHYTDIAFRVLGAARQAPVLDAEGITQPKKTESVSEIPPLATRGPDIVEIAAAAGEFDTLMKAVVAAHLYDTLLVTDPLRYSRTQMRLSPSLPREHSTDYSLTGSNLRTC
jgi:hypothetical protein